MPRPGKTATASRSEASLYLGKAEQFLDECAVAIDAGRHDAAMLNAIHAAISATDAVTVGLAGRRSSDPDHQRAADLLEQVAGSSGELRTHVRQLRELLAKKNVVEYESRRATAREARDALRRAERLILWAGEAVEQAKL
jgi:HEPN domain-containing protein